MEMEGKNNKRRTKSKRQGSGPGRFIVELPEKPPDARLELQQISANPVPVG